MRDILIRKKIELYRAFLKMDPNDFTNDDYTVFNALTHDEDIINRHKKREG